MGWRKDENSQNQYSKTPNVPKKPSISCADMYMEYSKTFKSYLKNSVFFSDNFEDLW